MPTIKIAAKICNTLGGTLDYYYFGKIEEQNTSEIIQSFQQLTQAEQKTAMELMNTYIRIKYKVD